MNHMMNNRKIDKWNNNKISWKTRKKKKELNNVKTNDKTKNKWKNTKKNKMINKLKIYNSNMKEYSFLNKTFVHWICDLTRLKNNWTPKIFHEYFIVHFFVVHVFTFDKFIQFEIFVFITLNAIFVIMFNIYYYVIHKFFFFFNEIQIWWTL